MTTKLRAALEESLRMLYQEMTLSPDLNEAISYSLEAGGKRLRPLFFLELVMGFLGRVTQSHLQVAASIEMIHTGSLIHDDLPAMDDDDYRRGMLTNHKRYGEATAILAGDALFLDSFSVIAAADFPPHIALALVQALSQAAGSLGMVGGQALDMMAEGRAITKEVLVTIHSNKTGKLLAFPFLAAGIVLELPSSSQTILASIGENLGLAFQVRDDILDVTADFESLGKTPQKDNKAQKATYPFYMGLEGTRQVLEDLLEKSIAAIKDLETLHDVNLSAIRTEIEGLRLDD